jgi:hypothetical protein
MAAPGTKFPAQNFIREKELRATSARASGSGLRGAKQHWFQKRRNPERLYSLFKRGYEAVCFVKTVSRQAQTLNEFKSLLFKSVKWPVSLVRGARPKSSLLSAAFPFLQVQNTSSFWAEVKEMKWELGREADFFTALLTGASSAVKK